MTSLVALLTLLLAGAFLYSLRMKKSVDALELRLRQAARELKRHPEPYAALETVVDLDWELIDQGGDAREGRVEGVDSCPGQSGYSVVTSQLVLDAWPNPAQVASCTANPPAPAPPEMKCPAGCVQVMTHVWHSWEAYRHAVTDQIKLNCNTFAQYHCMKPDDPARHTPPRQEHPHGPRR